MGDGFGVRVALFYAGLFAVVGIQAPFFPVWLQSKNLDAAAIGFVLATAALVRVVAMPSVARLADRRGLDRALVVVSFGAAAAYVLMGLADGFLLILAGVALSAALFAPLFPLIDAYGIRGLKLRGRAYGPVRLWGSVAFIAANLAAGYAGSFMAPSGYIWLMVAALVATAAASLALRPLQPPGAPEPPPVERRRTWSRLSRDFLVTAAAASLIQASHAVYYGFSTLDWTAKGLSGTAIGALWGLGVVAEIVLFAVSGRLPAAIGPRVLLIAGAAGGVVRWGAMALDPPTGLIPVLQCLHGLSFGATYLGAVQFLARTAPADAAATVQADLSTLNGLAMAAASGLSGLLYERFGDAAYAAMALCAALGGALMLLERRRPQEAD